MNARIGIKQPDGGILSVYLHWDPFPDTTGKILVEKYPDKEKALELILKGDISALEQTLNETQFYKDMKLREIEFYEPLCHSSLNEMLRSEGHKRAFIYIMMENEWYYFTGDYQVHNLKEL